MLSLTPLSFWSYSESFWQSYQHPKWGIFYNLERRTARFERVARKKIKEKSSVLQDHMGQLPNRDHHEHQNQIFSLSYREKADVEWQSIPMPLPKPYLDVGDSKMDKLIWEEFEPVRSQFMWCRWWHWKGTYFDKKLVKLSYVNFQLFWLFHVRGTKLDSNSATTSSLPALLLFICSERVLSNSWK